MRTDGLRRGELLIALLHNFTVDAQWQWQRQKDGDRPRFADLKEPNGPEGLFTAHTREAVEKPNDIGNEERAQAAAWQEELLAGMKRMKETNPKRYAELNAFRAKVVELTRGTAQDSFIRKQARAIVQELSPPAEGAAVTYHAMPTYDPDF